MKKQRFPSFAALAAAVALSGLGAAGCSGSIDRAVGVIAGDFNGRHGSATAGASYKDQFATHQAVDLTLAYANPDDFDAIVLHADFVTFGRIPEAGGTTAYVGFGLGMAMWTDDSPTERDMDFWLRAPTGFARRFWSDTGEVFFEAALQLGFDSYSDDCPFIVYGGGVRWKVGM